VRKQRHILPGIVYLLFIQIAFADRLPGKPVVFALDVQALINSKARILAKDESIMPAYKALLKDAANAMEFGPVSVMEKKNLPPSGDMHDYMSLAPYHWPDPTKPNGLPYIRKDGQTNPEVRDYKDKEYMPALCDAVQTLALAYYFSDDHSYAEHAAKLLRVWFLDEKTKMNPNLNYAQAIKGVNDGRGAGLIDSRHFIKLVDAIGLLYDSKFWKKEDQQGMKNWFASFLNWMQTSPNGIDESDAPNNHGAWYDAQRLSLALFIDSMDLAKKIVMSAEDRLDKQMDGDGKFPKEMERTTSFHYTCFVMNAFFTIAQMAKQTGTDLWKYKTPSGKSLKKAFDQLLPYLAGGKKWEGEQIKEFDYEEDAFPLLARGEKLGCSKCLPAIKQIGGEKAERLRLNLIY